LLRPTLCALFATLSTAAADADDHAARVDDAVARADDRSQADENERAAGAVAAQPAPAARKASREADKPCAASAAAPTHAGAENWQRRHRVSRIVGKPLCSLAGHRLGMVQDVIIDRQGRVAYGVIALERAAEAQGKLFLVPWRELKPHPAHDQFVLDISPERLLQAPAFDADDWPDITDKRWAREVNRFYAQGNGSPRAIRRDGGAARPAGPSRQPNPAEIAPMDDRKAQRGMPQRTRVHTVPLQPTDRRPEA
jgi:sporulation protein YlmC with PRC-barrel domain